MKFKFLIFSLFFLICYISDVQARNDKVINQDTLFGKNSIVINLRWTAGKIEGAPSPIVEHSLIEFIGPREWVIGKNTNDDTSIKWVIAAESPTYVKVVKCLGRKSFLFVAEPGDNITIVTNGKRLDFSGTGSEKYRVMYLIDSLGETIPKPSNSEDYSTKSIEDYLEWHYYLNRRLEKFVELIDSYKGKLTAFAYEYLRASIIDQNIDDRSDKFYAFSFMYAKKNGFLIDELCAIYDSTYKPATQEWFKYTSSIIYGNTKPLLYMIMRKYGFNTQSEEFILNISKLYDEAALKVYKGLQREQFWEERLTKYYIHDKGFTERTEKLLADYYATPGYPEYKKYVKAYELKARNRLNGMNAPEFSLTDTKGNLFTKEDLKGRIAVFDFWFTGCAGCAQMTPAMKKVEEAFKGDTNVVFLSVSIDENKSKWLASVAQAKYTTGTGINLYTGGKGEKHDLIRQYAITGYPALVFMDVYGRIINPYPNPDPRGDNGKALIALIQKHLAFLKDGPYVLHENDNIKAYSINNSSVSFKQFETASAVSLPVQTDGKETFSVTLKKHLLTEPFEFPKADKLLVLSDIEGNFDAFRKLLQANKIIDENLNWIFGNGHLVFGGDMVDRGNQVTECLWLLYSLEEKAKAAGGYVHFVLGNHEIMSLAGKNKYAQQKYTDNAKVLGITLKDLYNQNSELGRWLRTKNIIEKVGDILFVHGGMAKEFSDSVSISINEINDIARKYLGQHVDEWKQPDRNIRLIHSSSFSPFWFRTYYDDSDKHLWLASDHSIRWTVQKPDEKEMDSILKRWNVSRIITGHTIVADTISVHYVGKVINTDTKHASGKSEALLIEGDHYYRVNQEGKRVLLFVDDKKKPSLSPQ